MIYHLIQPDDRVRPVIRILNFAIYRDSVPL